MKKVLILFGLIFTIVSCSDSEQDSLQSIEESTIFNSEHSSKGLYKKSSVDPALKDLYVKMINSESYIKLENSIIAFNDKVGEEIPESQTFSLENVLKWVALNIPKTKFNDYSEASISYDEIIELAEVSNKENFSFFKYFSNVDSSALIPILEEIQTEVTGTHICISYYEGCVSYANFQFTEAVQKASLNLTLGQGTGSYNDAIGSAISTRNRQFGSCEKQFMKCLGI